MNARCAPSFQNIAESGYIDAAKTVRTTRTESGERVRRLHHPIEQRCADNQQGTRPWSPNFLAARKTSSDRATSIGARQRRYILQRSRQAVNAAYDTWTLRTGFATPQSDCLPRGSRPQAEHVITPVLPPRPPLGSRSTQYTFEVSNP